MDNKKNSAGLNLFLFGVIVGVAATLLLTTKKGRKLLKVLTDEGADRLTKFEKMVKEMEVEDEEYFSEDGSQDELDVDGDDYVKEEKKAEHKVEKIEVKATPSKIDEAPAAKKRLFRGIRKKTT